MAHRVRHRHALSLVNRVAEIGQLLQAWELAKTGRGHTVEITGEAGIGKSRLALELIDKTGLADELILAVHASAQHQNTPLYPIIRTLEQHIGIRKDEGAEANSARLRKFLATTAAGDEEQYLLIGQMLGLPMHGYIERDSSRCAGAASEDARRRCATVDVACPRRRGPDTVRGFSLGRSIDDRDSRAHRWPDRQRADLLVITSRTTTIRSGSLMIRRILVQRLDDDDCRDLAGSVVRDKRLPSQLIQQIVTRSDGVPLFVEELAAAALETGQIDPAPGSRRQ